MAADSKAFLERWHEIVASKDVEALNEVLADDVTLGAPPYWTKLRGKEIVQHLLSIIVDTIEDFSYQREWLSGSELALEFTGHIGEHRLQGIDLISLDDQNRLVNLDVMVRPINSVIALREAVAPRMAEFLGGRSAPEKR
jgi:hypothetical protein